MAAASQALICPVCLLESSFGGEGEKCVQVRVEAVDPCQAGGDKLPAGDLTAPQGLHGFGDRKIGQFGHALIQNRGDAKLAVLRLGSVLQQLVQIQPRAGFVGA